MPIILKDKPQDPIPVGTHPARCFRIVDCGTQPGDKFGPARKLVINWELPHERIIVDGKDLPKSIAATYTVSMSPKSNLRKLLETWRGRPFTAEELKGFHAGKLLGAPCMILVQESPETGKSKVGGVMAVPKGMTVPPVANPLVEYSIEEGRNEVFEKLPDWIKERCNACLEWKPQAAKPGIQTDTGEPVGVTVAAEGGDTSDEVPF